MYSRLGWALAFVLMTLGIGAGAYPPLQGIDGEFAGATGKLWSNEREQELVRAAHDGNPATYAVVTPESRETEVRVGLEWTTPKRLSGLKVVYASLNGAAYEPMPDLQFLEFRNGQEWRKLRAQVVVNYGRAREFAAYQNSGSVVWDYQFPPSDMNGVRVVLGKTVSSIRWEQRYAIRELQPYATEHQRIISGQAVIIDDSGKPEESGQPRRSLVGDAKISRDDKGTVLSWSRPNDERRDITSRRLAWSVGMVGRATVEECRDCAHAQAFGPLAAGHGNFFADRSPASKTVWLASIDEGGSDSRIQPGLL